VPTDGDIDYSGFTRAQLEEALVNIDGAAYPTNLQRLREALARKAADGPEPFVFPDRLVILGPGQVGFARVVAGVFAALGTWILATMAVRPQSFFARYQTNIPADVLSLTAQGWLVGLLFAGLGAWMWSRARRAWLVSVVGRTLEIRRGRESQTLPLSDVGSIDVVLYGDSDRGSLLHIVLRGDSIAGGTIEVRGASQVDIRRLEEIIAFVQKDDGS
jgi:hypothetical protein